MSLLPSRKDRQQPPAQSAIPPARRRISDGAAYFAQNIMDLENRCEELQRELAARDHQLSIQGVEIQSLRAALRATPAAPISSALSEKIFSGDPNLSIKSRQVRGPTP